MSNFAIPSTSDDFSAATAVVKSGAIPHATNDDKLRLYGLYKQATIGPAPGASSASIFDIVGQQKYSAWDKVRNLSADEAKQQYAKQESTAPPLNATGKKFIQKLCGKFLSLGRAVDSTLPCPISALAAQSSNPTKETM